MGTIGSGGIFGEMDLIDNSDRMASATSVEPSVCIMVPERVFQEKMENADSFIVALPQIFCNNIRFLQQDAEDD